MSQFYMLYNEFKKEWYFRLNLSDLLKDFGLKIQTEDIIFKKINFATEIENNNNGVNSIEKNNELFDLIVNLSMRRGNKKLALEMVKKSFSLLRSFFWVDAFFFIRLILIQSEAVFSLQRYHLGKREKIIPRFINEKKKVRFILRMLVKHARNLQKDYKYFIVALAHAIVEYSLPNNILSQINKEENELAESNKFFLFKKNRRKRRVSLFRKVNHWKKD